MAAAAITSTPTFPLEHYLNATYGIRSWLLTTDHKRIAPCLTGGASASQAVALCLPVLESVGSKII